MVIVTETINGIEVVGTWMNSVLVEHKTNTIHFDLDYHSDDSNSYNALVRGWCPFCRPTKEQVEDGYAALRLRVFIKHGEPTLYWEHLARYMPRDLDGCGEIFRVQSIEERNSKREMVNCRHCFHFKSQADMEKLYPSFSMEEFWGKYKWQYHVTNKPSYCLARNFAVDRDTEWFIDSKIADRAGFVNGTHRGGISPHCHMYRDINEWQYPTQEQIIEWSRKLAHKSKKLPKKKSVKRMTRTCSCGRTMSMERIFCPSCGRRLARSGFRICEKCGQKMDAGDQFCGNCGHRK